jgi:hypothetical protein
MNYQNLVFEKIKSSNGDQKDWVDQIGETLNISKSAVYKRLKGDTMLSMEDLVTLMKTFKFSFDDLIYEEKKQVGFSFPYKDREIKSFLDYIEPLKNFVLGANSLPEKQVQYATNEFHFFFYLHDKDLTYFKFYMFAKTVWNLASYKGKAFNLEDFSEWVLIEKDVDMILRSYYEIDNVEIWNGNVLANTLNQIKYALQSGLFANPEDALLLCDKLGAMIMHVSKMAELGKKFMIGQNPDHVNARIQMYHNEITYTSNLLLLESPQISQIYFAFDNPNYILSDEPRLVQYTHDWFERIKRNALPISEAANRNRRAFFGQIKKNIEQTKEQIAAYIKHEW